MSQTATVQAIAERIFTAREVKELTTDLIRLALKPELKRDTWYTYSEVAELFSVNYDTIYRAVKAERLKADYVGSEPRIRGAAILQWLDEGGRTGRSRRDLIEEAK